MAVSVAVSNPVLSMNTVAIGYSSSQPAFQCPGDYTQGAAVRPAKLTRGRR